MPTPIGGRPTAATPSPPSSGPRRSATSSRARREQMVSGTEFRRLLGAVKGPHFRDLLFFCWETGARQQEAKRIEARHFTPLRHRLELPPAESKGKKRWRIIYLTPTAEEIVARLAKRHPAGRTSA